MNESMETMNVVPPLFLRFAREMVGGDFWTSTRKHCHCLFYEGRFWDKGAISAEGTAERRGRTTAGALWALWMGETHPEIRPGMTQHETNALLSVVDRMRDRAYRVVAPRTTRTDVIELVDSAEDALSMVTEICAEAGDKLRTLKKQIIEKDA